MEFEVGAPVEEQTPLSAFVVNIKVMHGDADGYNTFQMGPFYQKDKEALASLIGTLQRMESKGRWGDGDNYYRNIEGFEAWFGTGTGDTLEEYRDACDSDLPYEQFEPHRRLSGSVEKPYYDGWPWDVTYEEYPASLDGWNIVYYDHAGVKHRVTVHDS